MKGVSAGEGAVALGADGAVWSWGHVGFDLSEVRSTPKKVTLPVSDTTGVAAGGYHQCALSPSGRGFCWGGSSKGQLGNGVEKDSLEPVEVQF
jgi:alpha-tubulin suppressor-like RCC1 family protein